MKKIFGNFKNIKLKTLLIALPLMLAYPIVKALISSANRLMIFSDALLIISLISIALGILFTFTRHGDFDITRYIFRRGIDKNVKSFDEYKKDREEQRDETFNYPLFFGLVFLAVSMLIAYVFC